LRLPRLYNSDYEKVKHAKDIMHLLPELSKANLFKLAWWTNQDLYAPLPIEGPLKLYMQVQRAKAKGTRKNAAIQLLLPIAPIKCPQVDLLQLDLPPIETPSVIAVHFDPRETAAVDFLSPLSVASGASS
jgi:hypothetical protein